MTTKPTTQIIHLCNTALNVMQLVRDHCSHDYDQLAPDIEIVEGCLSDIKTIAKEASQND